MTTLGDKMNAREVEDMVKVIFKEKDELVECEGIYIVQIFDEFMRNVLHIFRILFPALWECECSIGSRVKLVQGLNWLKAYIGSIRSISKRFNWFKGSKVQIVQLV